MSELAKKIAEEVREVWEGQHFTRNGEWFTAPPVRPGGATDTLIMYAVDLAEIAVREQVALAIEAYLPPGCADHDWCDLCYSEKEYIKIARATP